MKSMTKKAFLAIFMAGVFSVVLTAQPGQGQGRGNGPGWNNQDRPDCRLENIIPDLTEDQIAELKALRLDHLKVMQDFQNQMGEINAKQRTLMSANPVDKKATEKLIDEKTALMNKQMKAQLAHRAAIKEVLTEEQALVLDQRMNMNRGQFAQKGGKGQFQGKGTPGPRGGGRGMGPCMQQ